MTPQDVPEDTLRGLLRSARAELGWSQERLAAELGVNPRQVKRWEKDGGPADVPDDENEAALLRILPLDAGRFAAVLAEVRPRRVTEQAELQAQLDDVDARLAEVEEATAARLREIEKLLRRLAEAGVLPDS